MAISENKSIAPEFNVKNVEKLGLFKTQKVQILANAHHFGFDLEKSHLKAIMNPNSMNDIQNKSSLSCTFDFKSLKNDTKTPIKKDKKNPTGLDKERWIPLRDRSYYKSKAQYLKTLKTKVSKK